MDAVTEERGQAVIVAVLFLAVAAVALSGLRLAQERILAAAQARRAGEAAVEAATAVIADAYSARDAASDTAIAVADPRALEMARQAAAAISLANGGAAPELPVVRCAANGIDVSIFVAGHTYRAGFVASCSRP
jgi:hypothetical protein